MRYTALLLFVVAIAFGCSAKPNTSEVHQKETITRTIWTVKTEIFMEHEDLKPGSKSSFLIHLTNLKDFKPVLEGPLILFFTNKQGQEITVTLDKPEKPGIFKTDVTFSHSGSYTLTVSLKGRALSDEITVPDINVMDEDEKHNEEDHEEQVRGDIPFLKEQQWNVDFMVGLPIQQQVFSSFVSTGEILPDANAEATLSAPLSGTMSLSKHLPYIGRKVATGEVLAVIEPPISPQGGIGGLTASYAEAKNKLILAQKEHERAKRLYEAKAVPKRRLEEAELGLESAKTTFEPLENAIHEMQQGSSGRKVIVRAPFSGTVVELFTANGKAIDAGQPILRIINMSSVWLKANVPATEISGIRNFDKASFTVPGVEGELKPSRLVSINDVIDPKTRTVPVIFKVANNSGKLKVGMFADVSIKTGLEENALTLPEEAFFEDEGRYFVFIQREGESFERQEVKTGIRGRGIVQVLSGIKADDRIVLKGGYYVKLASLSSRMADPHAGHGH